MGDLSKDFSRHEHACRCGCGFDTVDVELNKVLQEVRDHYKSQVTITGPNRCKAHNAKTPGAAENSMHTVGKAADFRVSGISSDDLYQFLDVKYPNKYGIGLYYDRVHVDVRVSCRRWIG